MGAGGCAGSGPLPSGQTAEAVDTLIAGGTIYDGSGAPPVKGDVAIRGDRIVHAGPPRPFAAARTIDAAGLIVAPGFIDPHTHADIFLRSADPAERVNAAWLAQGAS
ncbi:MAG: amidohydrolase family protein, partial [Porphyrobacter sp.]|nr:amidohydrolase family protein [Porphyrobacter sp.]